MHESTYISSVKKHLPNEVFAWKINTRFANGTPDSWYSGNNGDLWIEYKLIKTNPKVIKPNLSALQKHWLNKRYAEGRNVAVIVQTPKGAVIFTNGSWDDPTAVPTPYSYLSRKQVAEWIKAAVML